MKIYFFRIFIFFLISFLLHFAVIYLTVQPSSEIISMSFVKISFERSEKAEIAKHGGTRDTPSLRHTRLVASTPQGRGRYGGAREPSPSIKERNMGSDSTQVFESNAGEKEFSQEESKKTLLAEYIPPEYPRKARTLGQEGSVKVHIFIENGKILKTTLVSSSGFEVLDNAALRAISLWKFRFVTMNYIQKISFKLE